MVEILRFTQATKVVTFSAPGPQGPAGGLDSTASHPYVTSTHSSGTSIAVTHNLGKQYPRTAVYITATGEKINCGVTATSTTVTTFIFGISQSANTLTFSISG